jgi:NAD-dependent dihydropyrimidine dehydrogenase PreA subunit
MAYVIAEPCMDVKDTACIDACPVDCIHPRKDEREFSSVRQLYIDGENCICCAACVPVCPVSAIYLAEELPEKWKGYAQLNAGFYVS